MIRIAKDSQITIDLVFANKDINVLVKNETRIADHAWLQIDLSVKKLGKNYREFSCRSYNKINMDKFLKLLEENAVQTGGLCVNARAKKYTDNIVNALNIVAPRKTCRIPTVWDGKKWFSEEIRQAAARRDQAYIRARHTDEEQDWTRFKRERNNVVKLIKVKKKVYYENMIDNSKNNPTKMWKTLKEIIKGDPKRATAIENIDFEILGSMSDCNLADKFHLYYVQSIENIVKSIGGVNGGSTRNKSYCIESKGIMDNFEMVEIEYLQKIVMGLPNKKGNRRGYNE